MSELDPKALEAATREIWNGFAGRMGGEFPGMDSQLVAVQQCIGVAQSVLSALASVPTNTVGGEPVEKPTKPFKVGEDWIPIHRNTLKRLGDYETLKAGIGKLSPDICKKAGMTEDQSKAVEALWALLDASDFHVVPASPSPPTRDSAEGREKIIEECAKVADQVAETAKADKKQYGKLASDPTRYDIIIHHAEWIAGTIRQLKDRGK